MAGETDNSGQTRRLINLFADRGLEFVASSRNRRAIAFTGLSLTYFLLILIARIFFGQQWEFFVLSAPLFLAMCFSCYETWRSLRAIPLDEPESARIGGPGVTDVSVPPDQTESEP